MTTPTHRVLVVGKLPTSVPLLLKLAAAIIAALTGNTFFPNAAAIIAAVAKALAALDSAETATKTRAKGTVATRNAARLTLVSALHAAQAMVQQTADADPEHAAEIVQSAGMSQRKVAVRNKLPFAVKQGSISGTAHLSVKSAGVRASYDWQWSGDAGKTWTSLPATLKASTPVTGLPPGTTILLALHQVEWVCGVT